MKADTRTVDDQSQFRQGAARPRILFIVDAPNWAHDFKTRNLARVLGNDYDIQKHYQTELTAADLDRADLILVYYWYQFEAMERLDASFRKHRQKLLIGVCSHAEIEGARGEIGRALLNELARGVFMVNAILFSDHAKLFDAPVFYTPNGVDAEFYKPITEKKSSSPLRVGWAGSLNNQTPQHRGYYDLIVPAVSSVGGVELVTAIREEKWRGPEEMRDFYRSLDLYLCASRKEGTPNPCMEAAACGVPLVTARVGAMPELVRHGINGFFIEHDVEDIAGKLRLLRDNSDLRGLMAQQIRKDIQAWDWSIRAEPYREMFEQTLRS
jgi:glycosyltransferase involved in cell wall biosynthesis